MVALTALGCHGSGRDPQGSPRKGEVEVGAPCPEGLRPVGGGCAPPSVARAVCGSLDEDDTCAPVLCPSGAAFEPTTRRCVPSRELGRLPEVTWLGVREGELLSCSAAGEAAVLEVTDGHVGCRVDRPCRFGRLWDGKACTEVTPCPVGALRAEGEPACRPFVRGKVVDLPTWATTLVGPTVCALLPVSEAPERFDLVVDATGGSLSQLSVAVSGSSTELTRVRRAVEALAEGLRSVRGEPSTSHVEARLQCPKARLMPPKVASRADAGAGEGF